MGLAYGAAGLGQMYATSQATDDYYTRMASGCAAGLTLGLANRSAVSACGACISLGMVSAALKYFDLHHDLVGESPQLRQMMRPVLTADVPPNRTA